MIKYVDRIYWKQFDGSRDNEVRVGHYAPDDKLIVATMHSIVYLKHHYYDPEKLSLKPMLLERTVKDLADEPAQTNETRAYDAQIVRQIGRRKVHEVELEGGRKTYVMEDLFKTFVFPDMELRARKLRDGYTIFFYHPQYGVYALCTTLRDQDAGPAVVIG